MKIRMKVAISGTRDGKPWPQIGGEIELPDHEGLGLCRAGLAEPVAELEKDVETAKAPEDGVEKRQPARSGRPRKQPEVKQPPVSDNE